MTNFLNKKAIREAKAQHESRMTFTDDEAYFYRTSPSLMTPEQQKRKDLFWKAYYERERKFSELWESQPFDDLEVKARIL